jgi:hypothetical protein
MRSMCISLHYWGLCLRMIVRALQLTMALPIPNHTIMCFNRWILRLLMDHYAIWLLMHCALSKL